MINKYQQGGAAPQQGGGILAQIQQLPQDQQQQLMQAFAQWAQQKGVDIQQLQQNPQALEQALGQFMQEMQAQQAQAAKHGAKLRYIKNLKHQCAEDEHLEYFAKGGAIGCNCVKNKQGGKAEPKKNALEQFKAKKGINLKKDKCGGKMKKHQIGGTIETLRQSLGLEKKNLNKYQYGGLVERTDNTRVASGRPQQISNEIPYGAGKGPAADSPMRLFNDPYVNMGLMAMGPLAKPKVQHDVFPVKEVLKFSFLPQKEIMTRMTTKYGNYQNIKGPKGRVNAWKIERQPGVDNFTEIQNLLFK